MTLEHVMGFKDDLGTASMYPTTDGNILYYSAAVGIVSDPKTKKQHFFTEHTDDITAIALHPNGYTVATGQVGRKAFMLVWDSRRYTRLHSKFTSKFVLFILEMSRSSY